MKQRVPTIPECYSHLTSQQRGDAVRALHITVISVEQCAFIESTLPGTGSSETSACRHERLVKFTSVFSDSFHSSLPFSSNRLATQEQGYEAGTLKLSITCIELSRIHVFWSALPPSTLEPCGLAQGDPKRSEAEQMAHRSGKTASDDGQARRSRPSSRRPLRMRRRPLLRVRRGVISGGSGPREPLK